MTWLYVPKTSSACAAEAAGSTSDLSWQCQVLEQSAWSRGKPSRSRDWSRRCARASWLTALCGAMSPPSTAGHGAASWIGSLAASRASLTAQPESGSDAKMSAICGPTPGGSSSSAARNGCLSRTSRACFPRVERSASSTTWNALVSSWRADYSARLKSASRISESACSSWPSPRVTDEKGSGPADRADRRTRADRLDHAAEQIWKTPRVAVGAYTRDRGQPGSERPTLEGQAAQWSTPRASDAEKGGPNQSFGAGGTPLPSQAAHWPTPNARDHFPPHSPERIAAMKALGHGMSDLPDAAAMWRTPTDDSRRGGAQSGAKRLAGGHTMNLQDQVMDFPSARPDPETSRDGEPSSPPRRSLNPLFVEWLMGWPPGWTSFACSEMAFTRWQQRMRCELSRLELKPAAPVQQSLL